MDYSDTSKDNNMQYFALVSSKTELTYILLKIFKTTVFIAKIFTFHFRGEIEEI